jgi:hypothetical protein
MRIRLTIAALAGVLLLSAAARAADDKDKAKAPPPPEEPIVQRIEIWNGSMRTIHYGYRGISPGEESSLHDLQRAENEVILADTLLALQMQYAVNDQEMEARRHAVQMLLYGFNAEENPPVWNGVAFGIRGYGYGGYYPYAYMPYNVAAAPGLWGCTGSNTDTLAVGIGDEGVLKNRVVSLMGTPALAEHAAAASRNLSRARSEQSDRVLTSLKLKRGDVTPVEYAPESRFGVAKGDKVAVTVKGADKALEGKVVRENADWLVIDTGDEEVNIRSADISRLAKKK